MSDKNQLNESGVKNASTEKLVDKLKTSSIIAGSVSLAACGASGTGTSSAASVASASSIGVSSTAASSLAASSTAISSSNLPPVQSTTSATSSYARVSRSSLSSSSSSQSSINVDQTPPPQSSSRTSSSSSRSSQSSGPSSSSSSQSTQSSSRSSTSSSRSSSSSQASSQQSSNQGGTSSNRNSSSPQSSSSNQSSRASSSAAAVSEKDAARFLLQAGFHVDEAEIARVRSVGFQNWLEDQFDMPIEITLVNELLSKGYGDIQYVQTFIGYTGLLWKRLFRHGDVVRKRVALALSEIVVVGGQTAVNTRWGHFNKGYYWDLLEKHSFGNYKDLLLEMSRCPAMAYWLTFIFSNKESYSGKPDENYAREIMQLFSLGLYELNIDGTLKLVNGKPIETYIQSDISGLARVFTGWFLYGQENLNVPDIMINPLQQRAVRHELGEKRFLGHVIPAGTPGERSLELAIDIIFDHPNVAPFISRQLIQRLVTSSPSPEYVSRVANIFNNNGQNVKGDMKAVIKAILLDDEARNTTMMQNPTFGKLREPMIRFIQWARTFGLNDPSNHWNLINTHDPVSRLGQSPTTSGSVFNFFRPGYKHRFSANVNDLNVSSATLENLTTPELQMADETTVPSYINFMSNVIRTGLRNTNGTPAQLEAEYSAYIALASNPTTLVAKLNLILAAGQLAETIETKIASAIATISDSKVRVQAAILLIMACPQYIVQK